jgi:hypothetical protein
MTSSRQLLRNPSAQVCTEARDPSPRDAKEVKKSFIAQLKGVKDRRG